MKIWIFTGAILMVLGCQIYEIECDSACQMSWIDGDSINDPCLTDTTCLVSKRIPNPLSLDTAKHVILAVHGFSASTYEWGEFNRYVSQSISDTNVLVSMVLMGAHGRNIQDFKGSSWQEWGQPIIDEYRALNRLGYRHLSLVGSSTACPLILHYIQSGVFDSLVPPKNVFLIDPIVVPSAKLLAAANLFGPIVGNSLKTGNDTEKRYWYSNRPGEALIQLNELINKVKNALESGIKLPPKTQCKVWKSIQDGAADPVGSLMIYKGLRQSDGGRIDAELVESSLHVFTRLQGRNVGSLQPADSTLQLKTFAEMLFRLKN